MSDFTDAMMGMLAFVALLASVLTMLVTSVMRQTRKREAARSTAVPSTAAPST
jgi:hypothetical protein